MEKKVFYRVEGADGHKGLWYDKDGQFSNRISKVYPPCKNGELPMPYDEKVIGYLSCVEKLEDLYYWFSEEDLISMKEYSFILKKFESTDYKFYDSHWLMSVDSKVIEIID